MSGASPIPFNSLYPLDIHLLYSLSMSRPFPKPPGWYGGGDDWTIVRQLDGHCGVNVETDGTHASDIALRRNERTWEQADLGGDYYAPHKDEYTTPYQELEGY